MKSPGPPISMRNALTDRRLLGNVLAGDSWATWRTVIIAAMGEKLSTAERAVFSKFTGRLQEPNQRIEEALFLVGRRGGKDRAASVLAAFFGAFIDWSPVLARGERGLILCIAPDQRQAQITRNYIEAVFDSSAILRRMVINRTADSIELSNNISIEVRASSFRRLRGLTCVAVIATEAAYWLNEESANADVEILNSVRPSLATTGGPVIIISTPYARKGEVWDIYRRNFGPAGDPRILVVQGGSRDFNPSLSEKVITRALERDPASASAEYLAEFRNDLEAFISREVVESCIQPGRYELPPVASTSYVAFVDPSGGSSDSMSLGIAHREGGRGILDCIREIRPPFDPDIVTREFSETLKSYRLHSVVGDRYGGSWPAERFRAHGIKYEASERTKSEIYGEVLPLLNSGRIELLDNQRLIAQLCALERRTRSGGRDNIDHGPGQHDDVCNAAAGALVLAAGQSNKAEKWAKLGRADLRGLAPLDASRSAILYAQSRGFGRFSI